MDTEKMIKSKLKGLPEQQVDMLIEMISKNPEFFKQIERDVKAKTKAGMNEQAAMMQVMREKQPELQKMFMEQQAGK